jgi:hypothetical protein
MRAVGHELLVLCLLLGVSRPSMAADKIRVEIVEATATLVLVARTSPGTPEQIRTHCNMLVDVNCTSTVIPATDPSSSLVPEVALFDAKAVLPDGSHVELTCSPSPWNKKCRDIAPIVPNAQDSAKCFLDAIATLAANPHAAVGSTASCTTKNLGFYRGVRNKDEIVIHGPDGKLQYRISGSW